MLFQDRLFGVFLFGERILEHGIFRRGRLEVGLRQFDDILSVEMKIYSFFQRKRRTGRNAFTWWIARQTADLRSEATATENATRIRSNSNPNRILPNRRYNRPPGTPLFTTVKLRFRMVQIRDK